MKAGESGRILLDAEAIQGLALVAAALGEPGFDRHLLDWLRSQVGFDSALVLIYPAEQRPQILVDALDNRDRQNTVRAYVDAAYLLDPFYRHARRTTRPGLVRLHEIMPEGFARSAYVETYYRRSAIRDEVNYLIPIERATYALCLERSTRRLAFSPEDLQRLRLLLPLVASLVRRHCRLRGPDPGAALPDDEHLRLRRVLANFGGDVLTPREREVVGLMLGGQALAEIAADLKISPETARVHRRNIYEKLDIGSLAELFSRALAELAGSR
jgi:DNA-binding CsgD family transcriptional regulator